jgi:hypothetical protein
MGGTIALPSLQLFECYFALLKLLPQFPRPCKSVSLFDLGKVLLNLVPVLPGAGLIAFFTNWLWTLHGAAPRLDV